MKRNYLFLAPLLIVLVSACQVPIELSTLASDSHSGARVSFVLPVQPGMNITTALVAACIANTTVTIPEGTYTVDPFTITASNLTITSSGAGATLVSSVTAVMGSPAIVTLGSLTNLTFQNINFVSTQKSTNNTFLGLVTSQDETINGLTFDHCKFTAPNCNANGLKFTITTKKGFLSNLTVQNCVFRDIGRMGAELTVHRLDQSDQSAGFQNVVFLNNEFHNLGLVTGDEFPTPYPNGPLIPDHWGIAISLSGVGNTVQLSNNVIDNPYNIGLEVTGGCTDVEIAGNTFYNLIRTTSEYKEVENQARSLSIMSVVANPLATTPTNARIFNNQTKSGCTTGGVVMGYLRGSLISSNNFKVDGSTGWWAVKSCVNNTFTNNSVNTSGWYGFYISGTSVGNFFKDTYIDALRSPQSGGVVQFDGLGVTKNQFCGLTTSLPANYKQEFTESNGAMGNTKTCTSNISGSYNPATQSWTTSGLLVGESNYAIQIRDSNKGYLGDNGFLATLTSGNQWSIQGKKLSQPLPPGDYYLYAYSPTSGAGVWSVNPINVPPLTGNISNVSGSYDPTTQSWTTSGLLVGESNYAIQIRDSNKGYLGDNGFLATLTSGNQWSIQGKKLSQPLPAGDYYLYGYSPTSGVGVWSVNPINVPPTGNTSTSNISGSYNPATQSWTTSGLLVGESNYAIQIRSSTKTYLGDNSFLATLTSGNQWSIQGKKLSQPLPPGDYYLYAYSPTSGAGVWSATTIKVP